MIAAALLLLLLFLAGLLNLNSINLPSKKLRSWLHSIKQQAKPPPAAEAAEASVPLPPTPPPSDADEEMTSVFATFDKNGDGFITKQELKESLRNIRICVTETEVEEMVVKVDSNGDGLIDLDEFKILCRSMYSADARNADLAAEEDCGGGGELKEAFDVFDRDKDGLITVEELRSVLSSLGLKEGRRIEDCKEMIRRVDVDGDGMVNFDEFKTMMRSGGGKLLIPVF